MGDSRLGLASRVERFTTSRMSSLRPRKNFDAGQAALADVGVSDSVVEAAALEVILATASWAFSMARVTSVISCFRSFWAA